MNSKALFLAGCIPVRLALVYLFFMLGRQTPDTRQLASIVAILIGFVFIGLWYFHLRQNATEAGGITWWDNIRPIHGSLWILAGLMLMSQHKNIRKYAWMVLLLDVFVGLGAWLNHHYIPHIPKPRVSSQHLAQYKE